MDDLLREFLMESSESLAELDVELDVDHLLNFDRAQNE